MKKMRSALLERYRNAVSSIASHSPAVASGDAVPVDQLLRRQARVLSKIRHDDDTSPGEKAGDKSELLLRRLDDLASIAMSKFYAYRYDRVPDHWRHLYTDTLILMSYVHLLRIVDGPADAADRTWDILVETLDRALITSGGQTPSLPPRWIDDTMQAMEALFEEQDDNSRPQKRQKKDSVLFPTTEPFGALKLSPERECPRHHGWTLARFENYMNENGHPKPLVFTDLISHWPALTDHPWRSVDYLLSRTLGGRRLVPVEIGRSYVDQGWGQELTSFRTFLEKYVLDSAGKIGYLAQHDLLKQVPGLRSDIQIPDFCWADVPGHPNGPEADHATLETPQLNAWFGPARTITPLHTDGYHNLLCQVVGRKYVRLYPPSATRWMRPRSVEQGVDMSNTAEVDVGVVEGWDPPGEEVDEETLASMREELRGVEYWECILGPGDTLLIPMGWWHYVRSLSVSFSVSFWWN